MKEGSIYYTMGVAMVGAAMVSELSRAWVDGWVVSRGTPSPSQEPWGLRIDVGRPDQVVRHVLLDADEVAVRKVAETVEALGTPATWLKAFMAPEDMGAWLGPDWTPDSPGFLMAADLRPSAPRTPGGYTLTTATAEGVTRVRVLAADGSLAARGQVAPVSGYAVVDQVETAPEHQRRGLGSFVMHTLADTAVRQGAATGVLGATVEGRALYETLGWRVHAPLTGFIYRAVTA